MAFDVYRITRQNGAHGEIRVPLSNDNWRTPKDVTEQNLLVQLNNALSIRLRVINPVVRVNYIKRTI